MGRGSLAECTEYSRALSRERRVHFSREKEKEKEGKGSSCKKAGVLLVYNLRRSPEE